MKHIDFFKISQVCMTGGNWNSDCACAHVPSSMRSLHTFHADAEFCITEFSQCPRGFQKLYLAVSPEAYPSLGTWSRRLVVLLGSSKINPVGEKTQISLSHDVALSGLPVSSGSSIPHGFPCRANFQLDQQILAAQGHRCPWGPRESS